MNTPVDRDRGANSKSRAADETSSKERPPMDAWAPSQMITAIPDTDGMRFRWVREYVNGVEDARNVQQHLAEGYARVRQSELPAGAYCEEDRKGDGYARWGGLILMRLPVEFAQQRQAYYQKRSREASNSADVLQGIAGKDAVKEDRGTRALDGAEAGRALASMSKA
jgi:hypothetical protein